MELLDKSQLIKFENIHHTLFNMSVEFVENYIYNSNEQKMLLDRLSDKNILVDEQYKLLKKNNGYIIGFILLNKKNNSYQFIDYIDTRLRKHNLASYMIQLYETQNNIIVIPYDILKNAAKYWKKYFEYKYNIKSLNEINTFIQKFNLTFDTIRWNYLINLFNH
jgi:hypothetical protein